MNKSIISRAGAALLSFVLAGVVSAKPVNGPSVTIAVSSQDEPNCTFAYAIIYGPGCWVRVDTCGNVDVHGCLDEAALLPRFEQMPAQILPTESAFQPAWLKEAD